MKPVFRHKIVPVEINVGSPAMFECDTEDAPNVVFKWFKDGHPIKDGDKCRIISRVSASSLELLSPNKDDSGEYSCKASNQHGSDECSASLRVTGKGIACFPSSSLAAVELLLVLQLIFIFPRCHLLLSFAGLHRQQCFKLSGPAGYFVLLAGF